MVYPAFIARNFPENIEAFRNELMSRSGYVRMTDSYHPDEYYLAKYMDGLDADVAPGGVGAQFNLTFKRDPRRFLVSGETPISVTSSGNITNPTLFASKPQIKITPKSNMLGLPYYNNSGVAYGVTFTKNNDGTVTANGTSNGGASFILKNSVCQISLPAGDYVLSGAAGGCELLLGIYIGSDYTQKAHNTVADSGTPFTISETEASGIVYVAIWISDGTTVNNVTVSPMIYSTSGGHVAIGDQTIELKSVGDYVVIDSEIQSCYRGYNNLNSQVAFTPNDFPVLKPGENGIELSSNIESVEITPNWYIV